MKRDPDIEFIDWVSGAPENRLIAKWVEAQNRIADTVSVEERGVWAEIAMQCERAIAVLRSDVARRLTEIEAKLHRARLAERKAFAATTKLEDEVVTRCNGRGAYPVQLAEQIHGASRSTVYRAVNRLIRIGKLKRFGNKCFASQTNQ